MTLLNLSMDGKTLETIKCKTGESSLVTDSDSRELWLMISAVVANLDGRWVRKIRVGIYAAGDELDVQYQGIRKMSVAISELQASDLL